MDLRYILRQLDDKIYQSEKEQRAKLAKIRGKILHKLVLTNSDVKVLTTCDIDLN